MPILARGGNSDDDDNAPADGAYGPIAEIGPWRTTAKGGQRATVAGKRVSHLTR